MLHASRGDGLEVARRLDERLGPFLVEGSLGAHAADDPAAAHGDVGFLVGEQNRGADPLVAAACGVGAVDAGDDGNAFLLQLRMAEEAGALPPAVGVDLLLLGKLHAGAVHEPHQRQVESILARSVTLRLLSACPAIQAPAIHLLLKPTSTHHLPLIRARPSTTLVWPLSSLSGS